MKVPVAGEQPVDLSRSRTAKEEHPSVGVHYRTVGHSAEYAATDGRRRSLRPRHPIMAFSVRA